MRTEPMPVFADYEASSNFCKEVSAVVNDGDTEAVLKAADEQIQKFGLEILLLDNEEGDYNLKVVPQGDNTVLALSPAHVLALRKYLSLDMGRIGVTDNPALYLLLVDTLNRLGGYRGYQEADDKVMDAHCQSDPKLQALLLQRA